ncbi:MAG TPA: RHS repeat-associated core domain-containing protein [Streptosporangiaceae bacterium]|jgi:RHS repeat-associated protein
MGWAGRHGGGGLFGAAGRARVRRVLRRGRAVVAAGLAPVVAAGTAVLPVVVTAGVAAGVTVASTVAAAAPARASASGAVLVLLQNGESSAPESADVPAGYSVTQVTPSQWEEMTAAQFEAYSALVIGDPSSGGSCSSLMPTTGTSGSDALGTTWQAAVTGNVAVLGTAPALPGTSGADGLISAAIGYAVAGSSSGTGTGLYVSLNCEYSAASGATDVSLLDGVEGIGTAGGLAVQGGLACTDPGTANTWEADAAGTFSAVSASSLGTGQWPSPGCPVQEAFDSWPAMFTPVAYDAAGDAADNFTASDGSTGQPYVLLGAPVTSATQALAPSTDGEVPPGTTAGGQGNAAAPGVAQASAADPVNTESGDFTQSGTDVSVPGFGPGLEFTRTYDAGVAQQQSETGTPGPMGYGWTDNWASSLSAASPVPGDIYTVAGLRTDTGQGGPAASAAAGDPDGVSVNGSDVYFADPSGNRIEEVAGADETEWGIAMTAGDLYTVVGSPAGVPGDSGNGTAATATKLDDPQGLVVNSTGMYIADTGNCRVVEIPSAATSTQWGGEIGTMSAGDLYVISGRTGQCAIGDDAKTSITSDLWSPVGLHFGQATESGDLYIADSGNNRIQEIAGAAGESEWGLGTLTAGDVYTVAGSSSGTAGDSGDSGAASSALLDDPQGVTTTGSNDLYIADTGNCRVQEVPDENGTQWNLSASFTKYDVYTVAGRTGTSDCTIGDDGKTAVTSNLDAPAAVAFNYLYGLYIADTGNNRVQEVSRTGGTQYGQAMTIGYVYTLAGSAAGTGGDSGDGGAAASALMSGPAGVWADGSGNLYIGDTGNDEAREVSASPAGISDLAGDGYTTLTAGNGGPAATSGLNLPQSEAFDAAGDVFIADGNNNRVQEIAAYSHEQFGITMTAGDIYTVAGSAAGAQGSSGDGGKATKALLYDPQAVAVSAAGNLYIDDGGNSRIQEVSTGGTMSTAAGITGSAGTEGDGGRATSAELNVPESIALDAKGDLYIADTFNNRIQEVYAAGGQAWGHSGWTAGDVYTIAGSATGGPGGSGHSGNKGPASAALLDRPCGIAADAAGNVYIADFGNERVDEIAKSTGLQRGVKLTANDLYVIAGSYDAGAGLSGDGGPAVSAQLHSPTSVAADAAGDVYIADSVNNRLQEVPYASGAQWGQSMTDGDMYTIAGSATGASGNSGDGGPATSAKMNNTEAVSVDPQSDVYVTDLNNNRLREIAATPDPTVAPAPGQTSSLAIYPGGTAPGGITVTQPGGAQVTFAAQSGGTCTAPYTATAGQYCVLPQDTGATLTYNSGTSYTYSPGTGADTYTYSWAGQLTAETDPAGNKLTIAYQTPAPGSGDCPAAATSCQTITSASGRALVLGSDASGRVTSVTDPMGRQRDYAYNSDGDLTSATDPMGHVTSYTYDGANADPMLASDLLTITAPDGQPGGPDAGDATVNTYDTAGRVTAQTGPMGYTTTFAYCANAGSGDCMNEATGSGLVTVTDPDGNNTVYDYDQGTLAAQASYTGAVINPDLASEQDYIPDTTAATTANTSGGTLLDTATADGDGNITTYTYDTAGNIASATAPDGTGSQDATTTDFSSPAAQDNTTCTSDAQTSSTCTSSAPGPAPVAPGGTITPPSSAPPPGVTWTLYDTDGNQLYTTTGVYQPGASTASYSQTTYQLFAGDSVTLPGTGTPVTCTATPPSASLPCATINADGVATQLAYSPVNSSSYGDLISSSTPDGNGSETAATTYAYNADGQQTSTTAPDGNLAGANAGNYTTVTAYNNDGQKTSVTQAGGSGATVTPRSTGYGYDADGNQATVTSARGYTTTTTYNPDDEPALVTDPDSNATLTCYDGDGNTAQTVPAVGVAASSLTPASCPSGYPAGYGTRLASDATVLTYNVQGKVTQQTTPAPAGQTGYETTSFTYDSNGNALTTTAPPVSNGGSNQVTTDTYTPDGQLATSTTGYGTSAASTIGYCYDPNGDRTSVIYADGNANGVAACSTASPWAVTSTPQANYQAIYAYDSVGELVSTTTPETTAAPNGTTTTSTYDPAGNMLTSKDPDGVTTTWTYTPLSQTASVAYSGSSAHSVAYSHDASGNRTGMTDVTGSSAYIYDQFGELTSAANGAGQTTSYSFDADGDPTGITYPLPASATWAATRTVSYTYDHADQLTGLTDFNNNQIAIANTADGLPKSQALGSSSDSINISYDNTDTPSAIMLKNSTSTLQSFTYTDEPSGDILTETDSPSSPQSPATYTYDAQGRVTSDTPGAGPGSSYSFDASGSLTTLPTGASVPTGGYDNAGELVQSTLAGATTTYTYNADGEQLAATQNSTTLSQAMWNGAEQLAAYNSTAADMTSATYDGDGNRASSTVTPSGGSATNQGYVWNTIPPTPQLLQDSTNAYIYDGGLAPAEQVNLATGTITYLVTDSLGSVRGAVTSAGSLLGTTSYDAWGNPANAGGLTAATPFGYAGGYTDLTGLIYLMARYYNPQTGQFESLDPAVSTSGEPYSYAGGNPVSYTDPTGTWWKRWMSYSYWECGWIREAGLARQFIRAAGYFEGILPANLAPINGWYRYQVRENDYRWIGKGRGCDPWGRCGKRWYSANWVIYWVKVKYAVRVFWWTAFTFNMTMTRAAGFYINSG